MSPPKSFQTAQGGGAPRLFGCQKEGKNNTKWHQDGTKWYKLFTKRYEMVLRVNKVALTNQLFYGASLTLANVVNFLAVPLVVAS